MDEMREDLRQWGERFRKILEAAMTKERKVITFGDVLDLIDRNCESDEEVILHHGSDDTALRGPMCSMLWEPLEARAVNSIGISDDPFFEIWLEDEDDDEDDDET
jgi:hypothetical protein